MSFYASAPFAFSPAAAELEARFGTPLNLFASDAFAIARFLRVLNGAFNLDIARQRLAAVQTLLNRFGDTGVDVQRGLMELADAEVEDALEVLGTSASGEIVPNARTPAARPGRDRGGRGRHQRFGTPEPCLERLVAQHERP